MDQRQSDVHRTDGDPPAKALQGHHQVEPGGVPAGQLRHHHDDGAVDGAATGPEAVLQLRATNGGGGLAAGEDVRHHPHRLPPLLGSAFHRYLAAARLVPLGSKSVISCSTTYKLLVQYMCSSSN